MALFYSIPIGAVQAIIEVDRLRNVPGFKQLVSITFVRSLIEAILPRYAALPRKLTSSPTALNEQANLTGCCAALSQELKDSV